MSSASLDRVYAESAPFGTQEERYKRLRAGALTLAQLVRTCCPPSREESLAQTLIQQACLLSQHAIACHEEPLYHPDVVDQVDGRLLPLDRIQFDAAETRARERFVAQKAAPYLADSIVTTDDQIETAVFSQESV